MLFLPAAPTAQAFLAEVAATASRALVDWANPAPAVGAAFNLLIFGS